MPARPRSSRSVATLLPLVLLLGSALWTSQSGRPVTAAAPRAETHRDVPEDVLRALEHLPVQFVGNGGQVDSRVVYYAPGQDKTVFFTEDGLTFRLDGSTKRGGESAGVGAGSGGSREAAWSIKVDFPGARTGVRPRALAPTGGVVSYFGGAREEWKAGLPTFSRIVYPNLWPGIDLAYRGEGKRLKYEFVVRPGADPASIRMRYRGAADLHLNPNGEIEVRTPVGNFKDERPFAYQERGGKQEEVASDYQLRFAADPTEPGNPVEVSFHLGAYDRTRTLVVDPATFFYSGFITGSAPDAGNAIAVDGAGNAYVTGITSSSQTTFPVSIGPDLTYNSGTQPSDVFVCKVRADGSGFAYCGYLGGSGVEEGRGIAVDNSGNAYLAGVVSGYSAANEGTFPRVVGPDLSFNNPGAGGSDAWVAKLSADGRTLLYCGFVGGLGVDEANGLAVDTLGNAYLIGTTNSTETSFPVVNGPDLTYNGGGNSNAFVARVNATGTALDYCGYLGGNGTTSGSGIAADSSQNAYLVGTTNVTQSTFPVTVGPDLTYNDSGVFGDVFVARLNATGIGFGYCGYVGGAAADEGRGIAVDSAGNAYLIGSTTSDQNTFPVRVGPDLTISANTDAFVAKVNVGGSELTYCGYVGGTGAERGRAIAVDNTGSAFITGSTQSSGENGFPFWLGPDVTLSGVQDAFVSQVDPSGRFLRYAGYIGGNSDEEGRGIAVDSVGNAYVTGLTTSSETHNFPLIVGPQLSAADLVNAFVCKIDPARPQADRRAPSVQITSPEADRGIPSPVPVQVNIFDPSPVTWDLSVDGKLLKVGTTSGVNAIDERIPLGNGAHLIEINARDGEAWTAARRSFQIGPADRVPPVIEIVEPRDNTRNANPVRILINIEDASAISWDVLIDARLFIRGTARGIGAIDTTQTLTNGVHTIECIATDQSSNRGRVLRTFTVGSGGADVTAPRLSINSPPLTSTRLQNPIDIRADIDDDSTVNWTLALDGTQIQTSTTRGVNAVNLTRELTQGLHTLVLDVVDAAGNRANLERRFTVGATGEENGRPEITITSPSGTSTVPSPVDVRANILDESRVTWQLLVDGVQQQTGNTRGVNAVVAALTLSNGTHSIEIRAADPFGNQSTASRTFTVGPTGGGGGTGRIRVTPSQLSFVQRGANPPGTKVFTIRNTGTQTVSGTIAAPAPSAGTPEGTFAIVSGAGNYVLAQGASLRVTVRFAGPAAGSFRGSIRVTLEVGGPATAVNVALSGRR